MTIIREKFFCAKLAVSFLISTGGIFSKMIKVNMTISKKFLTCVCLCAVFVGLFACACYSAESEDVASPKILAKVNGEEITELDVIRALQMLGQQAMLYGGEQGQKMILDELISLKLFALDAKDKKLDENPEFQQAIEDFKNRMLVQVAMMDVLKDVSVTDDEAKKFYDEHVTEYFTEPVKVHASHILISDDNSSQDIIAKIQAELQNGVSFDELAKKYSIEPGAKSTGGDLGDFPKGVMVKEFEDVAFALKNPGDVSEPVKTRFGWHIIKLHGTSPENVIPYNDELKAHIVQELQNVKSSELLRKHSEELEKKYQVERF